MAAERTEEPTPKRLEEARRRGEVAVSRDATSAAAMTAAIVALVVQGLAARRAGIAHLEVLPEQSALAAAGATLRQPTQHRAHKVARGPGYLVVLDHEL